MNGAMATVMLVPYPGKLDVVESNGDNIVTQIIENGNIPYWINAGVYLFDRQIESLLPDVGDHETTTFQNLTKLGRLAAYRSKMAWVSIDIPEDIDDLGVKIEEGNLKLFE